MAGAMRQLSIDRAATYKIKVQGELDRAWADWFSPMAITCASGFTTLSGSVVDQSAVYGVLLKLRDLGLPLVCICCVDLETDLRKSCCCEMSPGDT